VTHRIHRPYRFHRPDAEKVAIVKTANTAIRTKKAAALADAHRIAAATGARLFGATFNRLIQRGRGRHPIALLPYYVDNAREALAGIRHLILIGSPEPASFFAYLSKPSLMYPEGVAVHVLARPEEDVAGALAAVAGELAAPPVSPPQTKRPVLARGPVNSTSVAQTLAALIPEHAIIVDESISFGFGVSAAVLRLPSGSQAAFIARTAGGGNLDDDCGS
jgi:acetolactate synthase I/II/III large subunit